MRKFTFLTLHTLFLLEKMSFDFDSESPNANNADNRPMGKVEGQPMVDDS